jgi:AcrR family transcriptional regulator
LTGEAVQWRGEPLPRGRHKLAREHVLDSQRDRLLRAMRECVAANGYADTTVSKVAAAARVSPNRFYEFFRDKTECFLAVCDADATELLDALFALGTEADWVDGVREGMRVYLRHWRDRPQASRAYLLEMPSAGAEATAQRNAVHDSFVSMFAALARRARADRPELPPVSRTALRVFVAGTTDLIAAEVAAGRLDKLPELEDELVHLLVRVLADDAAASRVA